MLRSGFIAIAASWTATAADVNVTTLTQTSFALTLVGCLLDSLFNVGAKHVDNLCDQKSFVRSCKLVCLINFLLVAARAVKHSTSCQHMIGSTGTTVTVWETCAFSSHGSLI